MLNYCPPYGICLEEHCFIYNKRSLHQTINMLLGISKWQIEPMSKGDANCFCHILHIHHLFPAPPSNRARELCADGSPEKVSSSCLQASLL